MEYIIIFLSSFIVFFFVKYIVTLFYTKRYYKVILVDSLIASFYILSVLWVERYYNEDIPNVLRILLFWFIIPYVYAFVKPKILRRYYDWEVGMYYPIMEFFTIIIWVLGSMLLGTGILRILWIS